MEVLMTKPFICGQLKANKYLKSINICVNANTFINNTTLIDFMSYYSNRHAPIVLDLNKICYVYNDNYTFESYQ